MLSHIYIKNFAIVREIDIDLESGFNIITGETGTGKSVVIQAVSMALGGRGSSSLVGKGCDRALVQLIFSLSEKERQLIEENCDYALDPAEEDLILSRDFQASGKSIARVNGRIVNLSVLSSIASILIDIHGQYDNQTLLRPENHREILDSFAGPEIPPVKKIWRTHMQILHRSGALWENSAKNTANISAARIFFATNWKRSAPLLPYPARTKN